MEGSSSKVVITNIFQFGDLRFETIQSPFQELNNFCWDQNYSSYVQDPKFSYALEDLSDGVRITLVIIHMQNLCLPRVDLLCLIMWYE